MTTRRRIGVLRGGPAREHAVSLGSGAAVARALRTLGHDVVDIVIDRGGRWAVDGGDADRSCGPRGATLDALESLDVAFLALHGPWGEDGTVQGLLESFGVAYTGSGVLASALAMDKVRTKEVLLHHGVTTPAWCDISSSAWKARGAEIRRSLESLPGPYVVKPARDGSSFGVALVNAPAELPAALDAAFGSTSDAAPQRVIVEQRIAGTEVTCPVLGNADGALETLPLVEIVPRGRAFFDYEAKYEGASDEICPARIDNAIASAIRGLAMLAHRTLGCEGLTRTDFIVDAAGDIYFLEINTTPGMTEASLCPLSAAADGIGLAELCSRVVDLALASPT